MRAAAFTIATVAGSLLLACGGAQRKTSDEDSSFRCNDRRAQYVVTGGMMYDEQGVRLRCTGDSPVVELYTIDKSGTEATRPATNLDAWEKAWDQIEAAGWRNIKADCKNPDAQSSDLIYTFEISDGTTTRTFMCQGHELPFPFDRLQYTFEMAGRDVQ